MESAEGRMVPVQGYGGNAAVEFPTPTPYQAGAVTGVRQKKWRGPIATRPVLA